MKAYYRLKKSIDKRGRTVYGIEIIQAINDIFPSEQQAKIFVDLCNELSVSEVHIEDVLQDYLLECESTVQ